jgi:heptosyltransferase-2
LKILIELPTWLGDAVMSSVAIENLIDSLNPKEVYFVGSFVSIEIFKAHPKATKYFVDNTKKANSRFKAIYKLAKDIGPCDLSITFRNSFTSAILLYFTNSKIRIGFNKGFRSIFLTHSYSYKDILSLHQVQKYSTLVKNYLNQDLTIDDLKLYFTPKSKTKKLLGINAGATYGSAKRWYPEEFAKVATQMSISHDILIFGSKAEEDICSDIATILDKNGIKNHTNLAGKTTIKELIENIASLDIFITNDSGPMHIAAAFKINTFAIFGPTNHLQTNQWKNPNENIIRRDMNCAPCMKRVCPYGHHDCMKLIKAEDVLIKIKESL